MTRARLAVVGTVLATLLLAGPALADSPARGPESAQPRAANAPADSGAAPLEQGYQLFEARRHAEAAVPLYHFIAERSFDDPNYEWALFFFGVSLHEMGLPHAAVDTLSHLVTRKPNTRIVNYSLEILEETARTRPFDRERVLLDVLCSQEYGFVGDQLADFIHYHQGLYDWEHGYTAWGDAHFAKLREGGYYHDKYLYQKALYRIYAGEIEQAAELLRGVIDRQDVSAAIADQARVTLARVLYEMDRYRDSDAVYREIEKPTVEQARTLLERAWNHYQSGYPERAMGLLYAYRAPRFWRHFTAEYFILKSLIYKDVCQYREALGVVQEFKARFGNAIERIYRRSAAADNEPLLLLAMQRQPVQQDFAFLRLLERERERVQQVADAPALRAHLEQLYDLQLEETGRSFRRRVEQVYQDLAATLLRYAEQANLLEYEIGLDMYQRAASYHYEKSEVGADGTVDPVATVVYPFQGEFWNDELDDYQVVLENRCESLEDWDVFFE